MQPLLSCRDLVVEYPTNRGLLRAVNAVDLDIHPGETVALVGESGSGKSSLGRALVGLQRPTSGSIKLEGVEITGLSRRKLRPLRKSMQMVFQDPYGSLNPRLTVGKIIREPLDVHGVGTEQQRRARVADLLERVGLRPEMAARYPHEFSGGQRQRIVIARSLALQPKLIVCDEPVSALDVSVQAQVINLLVDLQRELGLSYLFISHDLSIVRHLSHRIAVMYLGSIVATGSRANFWSSPPHHPYVRRLLAATPSLERPGGGASHLAAGDDEIPSALRPPSGCRYRTRCEQSLSRCADEVPILRQVQEGEFAACHRVELVPVKVQLLKSHVAVPVK